MQEHLRFYLVIIAENRRGSAYDWTTGVPDNANEWRKFGVVPRSQPLRPLVLYLVY